VVERRLALAGWLSSSARYGGHPWKKAGSNRD